jgi:FAD/FMN-containing dehydrogenase
MNQLKASLDAILDCPVLDDPTTLDTYSRDASLFEIQPQLVVQPKTVGDLEKLVEFVNHNLKKGLSLTARSGGTDMTGGPLTESIVVDMKAYFNKIIEVGDSQARTQPGTYYRDFEKATLRQHLLMPSYPASREICTVGGMVSNNSGGEKTLSYGKTEDYVTELKMVLADGHEYTLKSLNKNELKKKIAQPDFEGRIYKKLYDLIEKDYDAIKAAKPNVTKNSAGYYLWNVWDRETGIFDINKLIVGSQGTLGLITEIKFKLITPKKHSQMVIIFLKDLTHLTEIVRRILVHKPESFESYDDHTLKLAMRFFPEIAAKMHVKNTLSLFTQFIPEARMILSSGMPKLVLLAEFTGDDLQDVHARAAAAEESLFDLNLQTYRSRRRSDEEKYWLIRRESFNLLRHHVRGKHTAPFIDDVVVTPEQLPQFLPELDAIMAKYKLIYTIAGHVGDANFHIIPLMDLKDPKTKKIIPELSEKVYELVFKYKGSITGEHNDGLIRTPYLKSMYGAKIHGLFKEVKQIFDPNNIFNPGKKVGSKLEYAMDHFIDDAKAS